ncbi:MAG TPA: hypothetical protein GX515_00375 [Firmicutes bacterium]|nr:hypothetical protein [Bacillota bacterium]
MLNRTTRVTIRIMFKRAISNKIVIGRTVLSRTVFNRAASGSLIAGQLIMTAPYKKTGSFHSLDMKMC